MDAAGLFTGVQSIRRRLFHVATPLQRPTPSAPLPRRSDRGNSWVIVSSKEHKAGRASNFCYPGEVVIFRMLGRLCHGLGVYFPSRNVEFLTPFLSGFTSWDYYRGAGELGALENGKNQRCPFFVILKFIVYFVGGNWDYGTVKSERF